MAHIRYTVGVDDAIPLGAHGFAEDVDFSVRLYNGLATVGVLRIAVHFPPSGRPPEITVVKAASAKWLDIMDGDKPCWPPVPRAPGTEENDG